MSRCTVLIFFLCLDSLNSKNRNRDARRICHDWTARTAIKKTLLKRKITEFDVMSDGTLRATHAVNGMRLKTYKLEAKFGYFMIGRNPKADLEINTEIISRKHVIFK